MTFDIERILESKRALRRKLAQLPIAQKLVILELLRDRALQIRAAVSHRGSDIPPEESDRIR